VICLPVGPRCDHCLLAKAKLCPSRVSNIKSEGRKEVIYTFTDEDEGEVKREGLVRAKVEIGYENDTPMREVKSEDAGLEVKLEVPGIGEEAVLEILDQVDGSKEIGA
jgi:endonuclease-3